MNRKVCCLVLTFILLIFLVGCTDENQSGLTKNEPNITVEYLQGDYVSQLLRDGASHVFGTISIEKDATGNISLSVVEKEYVEDSTHPNGYYIADKNMAYIIPLSASARTTFLAGSTSLPQIYSADEFASAFESDLEFYSQNNPDYASSKLYHIYIMNDQAELVLARYLP